MATKSIEADDAIVRHLNAAIKESPDLKAAAQLYEAILTALHDADLRVAPIIITPDEIHAKLGKGLPLLADLDISIDIDAAHDLMIKLLHTVEEKKSAKSEFVRRIKLAFEEKTIDISEIISYIVSGKNDPIVSLANKLDLEPHLLIMLAQNMFKSALRACCRQLTSLVERIEWQKGFCFVCGAVASLGELQGNNQAMHLRCGQCGADWPFRRLQCLYCGNEYHDALKFLYPEQEHEKMLIEVCDACKGYLKVIAAFAPTPPELLAVEDLATLHLDYIAQERGYVRRTVL